MFNKNTQNMTKNEALIDSIHKFDTDLDQEIKEKADEGKSGNGSNEEQEETQSQPLKARGFQKFSDYPIYHLKGHLDSVRDGRFVEELDQAITVSEDCTIRLWDLKNMQQDERQLTEDIKYNFIEDRSEYSGDPNSFYSYCTLRGHTGIVTKLAVDPRYEEQPDFSPIFYSAGIEGIIRAWKLPTSDEVKQFENDAEFTTKLGLYGLEAHSNEIVWDLKHHKYESMLLSSAADGLVSLWKTLDLKETEGIMENEQLENRLLMRNFQFSSEEDSENFLPTCLDWLSLSTHNFMACYNNDHAGIFDHQHETPVFTFAFGEPSQGNPDKRQINSVVCHPTMNVGITGSEDGKLGIFDLDAKGKCIRLTENTHGGPISSISINKRSGVSFSTSGHDGSIRFWDMRMISSNGVKMYAEIERAHQAKFGERICSLAMHSSLPILMSCGADSIVKLHTDIDM